MADTTEVKKDRQLSLMETFKLYVWMLWKAGVYTDEQVANIIGFCDRLGTSETVDFCMGQLVDVTVLNKEIYEGIRHGEGFVSKENNPTIIPVEVPTEVK